MTNNSCLPSHELRFMREVAKSETEFLEFCRRRKLGEPLQYILGSTQFFYNQILTEKGVFIPRFETEYLCEIFCEQLAARNLECPSVLDFCSGSGAITLGIAKRFPKAGVLGIDYSDQALQLSNKNKNLLGIENAEFKKADIYDDLLLEKVDAIISNPPYIPEGRNLPEEIINWEPHTALFSGKNGTDAALRILDLSHSLLRTSGFLMIEADESNIRDILLAAEGKFENARILKDLNQIERFLFAETPV